MEVFWCLGPFSSCTCTLVEEDWRVGVADATSTSIEASSLGSVTLLSGRTFGEEVLLLFLAKGAVVVVTTTAAGS